MCWPSSSSLFLHCQVLYWMSCCEAWKGEQSNTMFFKYVCMYIWGFRACQHLRSLASVMNDYVWLWCPDDIRGPCGPKTSWLLSYRWWKTLTGHRTHARYVTGEYATACSTAVDTTRPIEYKFYLLSIFKIYIVDGR